MKRRLKIVFGLLAAGAALLVSDPSHVSTLFVAQAEAVIGRPMTPVSYAGVARRTTRRTVYAASAASSAAASNAYYDQQQADYYNQQTAAAQQQTAVAQQQAAEAQQQAAVAQQQAAQAQQQVGGLPVGATLPSLPSGCDSTTVNSQSFFTCGGNWYRPAMQNGNIVYEVVEDPS